MYVQLMIETYIGDVKTWVPKKDQLKRYIDVRWEYLTGICRRTHFQIVQPHNVQFMGNFRELKLKKDWKKFPVYYVDMLSQQIL